MRFTHPIAISIVAVALAAVPLAAPRAADVGIHWLDAWKAAGGSVPAVNLNAVTPGKKAAAGGKAEADGSTVAAGGSARDRVPGLDCTPVATVLELTVPDKFHGCSQPFYIDDFRVAGAAATANRSG